MPQASSGGTSSEATFSGDTAASSSSTAPVEPAGQTPEELLAGLTSLQGSFPWADRPPSCTSGASTGSSALSGAQDPAEVRATLGNVASGLAEQLSSITEEMNKIRQELYGDSGIGGIAKELEKLKAQSGGLGGLLDKGGRDGMLRQPSSASSDRPPRKEKENSAAASSATDPDLGADTSGLSDATKEVISASLPSFEQARRRRDPARERDFEELRKKLLEKRGVKAKARQQQSVSIWEKLMLLFLVLVCLYIGSPFFRTSVKRTIGSLFGGQSVDGDDEDFYEDDGS